VIIKNGVSFSEILGGIKNQVPLKMDCFIRGFLQKKTFLFVKDSFVSKTFLKLHCKVIFLAGKIQLSKKFYRNELHQYINK
jgi:hypothetical protein